MMPATSETIAAGPRGDDLLALLVGRRTVALTGAGCSTDSGIPDYRGPGRSGPPRNPILHDAFMRHAEVRQRYWARATIGWNRFHAARPNAAHHALATMERAGHLVGVITQNVDRLHHAAGSVRVVELHGALADVRCLGCNRIEPRAELQRRLLDANPGWLGRTAAVAPDGDAEVPVEAVRDFQVVGCLWCRGALKPDVVFFGGNVGPATLEHAWDLFGQADVLLVLGSSLTVYSGFRFVRRARERGIAIAVVNLGPTRADELADVRVDARLSQTLPWLAARMP